MQRLMADGDLTREMVLTTRIAEIAKFAEVAMNDDDMRVREVGHQSSMCPGQICLMTSRRMLACPAVI